MHTSGQEMCHHGYHQSYRLKSIFQTVDVLPKRNKTESCNTKEKDSESCKRYISEPQ